MELSSNPWHFRDCFIWIILFVFLSIFSLYSRNTFFLLCSCFGWLGWASDCDSTSKFEQVLTSWWWCVVWLDWSILIFYFVVSECCVCVCASAFWFICFSSKLFESKREWVGRRPIDKDEFVWCFRVTVFDVLKLSNGMPCVPRKMIFFSFRFVGEWESVFIVWCMFDNATTMDCHSFCAGTLSCLLSQHIKFH